MDRFSLQGVVKNGQVVLETPLDLPDGTIVTVTDYDPDAVSDTVEPSEPFDPVKARQALFTWIGRPELANDPDWQSKLRRSA